MHGFKSFAQKTEIVFDKGINVVIGPNGSGKSNIADALCFVLGRLSTKSIRAAKAKNLLFMGSKYIRPSREAVVSLVFDNSDRTFPIDKDEIVISRTVRHNGLSIYRLNNETKTRSEVVETLAQAGIDPRGFNLILQGQIQSIVRMHPEDRRKVVEEVAGISIYESRKEKSLHELDKTEEKLKEINAILRERTAFLRNLENERSQALKFKELELTVKRCKASILQKRVEDKDKELSSILKSIEEKTSHKDKLRAKILQIQAQIDECATKINAINKHIQHASGIEQESIHTLISDLKAELEGLRVRKESFENRRAEIERRIEEMIKLVPEYQREIEDLRQESPLVAKKSTELLKKKKELELVEEQRKQLYSLRSELNSLKDRIRDKESQLSRSKGESDATLKQIDSESANLQYNDVVHCKSELEKLSHSLTILQKDKDTRAKQEIEHTSQRLSLESEIVNAQKIKDKVKDIDTCPLCQSKITEEHIKHVYQSSDDRIAHAKKEIERLTQTLNKLSEDKIEIEKQTEVGKHRVQVLERELSVHNSVNYKKQYLSRLLDQEKIITSEIRELTLKRDNLQQKTLNVGQLEEKYSSILMEIQEISSRTEKDIDQTLMYKERELEKVCEVIKLSKKDLGNMESEIREFAESIQSKTSSLQQKEEEERQLNERFKKMFQDRDDLQDKTQKFNYESSTLQSEWRQIEDQINYLKVGNAKVGAEKEAVEMELREFFGIELIKAPVAHIEERLQKAQQSLQTIGSINLRALEIYDEIKKEYERVQEKVNTLITEKEEIMKIIAEIDHKKKRSFMKTFHQINELFSTNFSRLSAKGQAFLEIENPEDIFAGGVSIVIRLAKGKYFDVASLSGGEQTLIALSLLFAIQEHKPYHFYIFDEIDAALDKRNSERLAALLKKYMKSGQYITITHNDALILDANLLYGVSMHDSVSKIFSLKLGEKIPPALLTPASENKDPQNTQDSEASKEA